LRQGKTEKGIERLDRTAGQARFHFQNLGKRQDAEYDPHTAETTAQHQRREKGKEKKKTY